MNGGRGRGVDGDDSLLASVAGVPLTRLARVGVSLIWAGFWAARVLLTDAMTHISPLDAKLLSSELLGVRAGRSGVQHLYDMVER